MENEIGKDNDEHRDDFDLFDDLEGGDVEESAAVNRWMLMQNKRFGTGTLGRGRLHGKRLIMWDYMPECVKSKCRLGKTNQCEFNPQGKRPTCAVVKQMITSYRRELYSRYQELDQNSLNKLGLELMPLIVIQSRMLIELSSSDLMYEDTRGTMKAHPLLKEYRSVITSIAEIESRLDDRLKKELAKLEGNDGSPKDPLRGGNR